MVAWSLKCNMSSYIFLDFHEHGEMFINSIYHVQNIIFYINRMPISYSMLSSAQKLQYHNL